MRIPFPCLRNTFHYTFSRYPRFVISIISNKRAKRQAAGYSYILRLALPFQQQRRIYDHEHGAGVVDERASDWVEYAGGGEDYRGEVQRHREGHVELYRPHHAAREREEVRQHAYVVADENGVSRLYGYVAAERRGAAARLCRRRRARCPPTLRLCRCRRPPSLCLRARRAARARR